LHVSGGAHYTDDLPEPRGLLHIAVGLSSRAHADILRLDLSPVLAADGVVDVLVAADIPGKNNFGPVLDDDPILAPGEVQYVGHAIFAVAAETVDQARRAARLAIVEYREREAILDPETAVAKG
jgi:xanthine dehydrogenase large subunit